MLGVGVSEEAAQFDQGKLFDLPPAEPQPKTPVAPRKRTKKPKVDLVRYVMSGDDSLEIVEDKPEPPKVEKEDLQDDTVDEIKPISKKKLILNTEDFDPELAAQFEQIIRDCWQGLSTPVRPSCTIRVFGYRFVFDWGSRKEIQYTTLIRIQDVLNDLPATTYYWANVEVGDGAKKVGQMIFFGGLHWSHLDWYVKEYAFRSQGDFDAIWHKLMRVSGEFIDPSIIKSRPSNSEEGGTLETA